MTRAFLYIRPDFFAVFDRVDALKPEFEKKSLLQMATEQRIEGDAVVEERNDLIEGLDKMAPIRRLETVGKCVVVRRDGL
jgi:hypothetical protein